jgi:hypothetical protein
MSYDISQLGVRSGRVKIYLTMYLVAAGRIDVDIYECRLPAVLAPVPGIEEIGEAIVGEARQRQSDGIAEQRRQPALARCRPPDRKATSAPTSSLPSASVACRRRRTSFSETPYPASAAGSALMSRNSIRPALIASISCRFCRPMPALQTGQSVLYQTVSRGLGMFETRPEGQADYLGNAIAPQQGRSVSGAVLTAPDHAAAGLTRARR